MEPVHREDGNYTIALAYRTEYTRYKAAFASCGRNGAAAVVLLAVEGPNFVIIRQRSQDSRWNDSCGRNSYDGD
jgi:hypothetical protein